MKRKTALFAISMIFAVLLLAGCSSSTSVSPNRKTTAVTPAKAQAQNQIKTGRTAGAGWAPSTGAKGSTAAAAPRRVIAIPPGSLVRISGAPDEKINGKYRVDFKGDLELPYNVRISTTGLREEQLKDKIKQSYRAYFKGAPNLSVQVNQEYWVEVRGLVQKPGRYLLSAGEGLDEVITKAGGLMTGRDGRPAAQFARIKQPSGTTMVRLQEYFAGAENILPGWQGGDVVFFQSEQATAGGVQPTGRAYVNVLGQVVAPGEYPYKGGADLLAYIIEAGGPSEEADLNRIMVVRDGANVEPIQYAIESDEAAPQVQRGDTIVVMGPVPTLFEKKLSIWSEIAGIIGALATIAVLFVAI